MPFRWCILNYFGIEKKTEEIEHKTWKPYEVISNLLKDFGKSPDSWRLWQQRTKMAKHQSAQAVMT